MLVRHRDTSRANVNGDDTMYKLFDLIRTIRAAMQPYEVAVCWGDKTVYHRAWTTGDAREWMACYPADAFCVLWTRRFRVIATRGNAATPWEV